MHFASSLRCGNNNNYSPEIVCLLRERVTRSGSVDHLHLNIRIESGHVSNRQVSAAEITGFFRILSNAQLQVTRSVSYSPVTDSVPMKCPLGKPPCCFACSFSSHVEFIIDIILVKHDAGLSLACDRCDVYVLQEVPKMLAQCGDGTKFKLTGKFML
jgi:hypothetical protein